MNGSAEKMRLMRHIARAEKELDKALMLLGRTQGAVVDAGSRIMELHAALFEMRQIMEMPAIGAPAAGREHASRL